MRYATDYGLIALFGLVLLEQLGAPIPSVPLLVLAGAKAIDDPLYFVYALVVAVVASAIGDCAWFWAGRRWGHRVLRLMCRVSLSPDSCVRQTETTFERRGLAVLVFAKFVPGLSAVAPPVAGALGLGAFQFLLFDSAGAVLYCGAFIVLGLVFHNQVDWLFQQLADAGLLALFIVLALIALYVAYRWWTRWRVMRSMRDDRIQVDDLYAMMVRGEDPLVLDVRSRTHRRLDRRRIPGATPVDLDDFDRTLPGIPSDREVIVYCACPNDVSAVRAAMLLRDRGIERARPLAGGLDAWVAAGLGIEQA